MLRLMPMPDSARQQHLICTLLVINSIALSSGEYHPRIPCVNNSESLSVFAALTFNILAGYYTYLLHSGSLANRYLNALKSSLVHS